MAKDSLKQKLSKGTFFLDGAMGTQLIARGIEAGVCNEMLNIESPQIIQEIHRSYFEAGADAVLTNTFGGNAISLARHGLADKIEQINTAAAENAKQAAGEDKYVLGDIGPSGDFLKPLGSLEPDALKSAYAKQAKALYEAGVDGFAIETFMAIDEAKVVVEAIKSVCSLPIFVSFAYDPAEKDFKTMMGASVRAVTAEFSTLGVKAIGFNCGTLQMAQYLQLTQQLARVLAGKDILLLAEPNAGQPELVDGQAVYKLSDADFADWAVKIRKAGANIIGGCCGTRPEHIKAMTEKLKV
ncbi:MAG: homocysteine S-methyltransferase family protein [Sedimentisphaerales bacterium]|nr:homocysteine S-methyltransferase family protein [Sedimentisphaerales bacterium]